MESCVSLKPESINTFILNDIVDMVQIVNMDNEIIYQNKAMERFIENHPDVASYACAENGYQAPFCDTNITSRTIASGEIIKSEKSIGDQYFSVRTSPILGAHREIIGAIEVYRNKSAEKNLQIELIEKNKHLIQEMNAASNIQRGILPKQENVETVRFQYKYQPAEIISGDMFDIIQVDDTHTICYVADVVGHGFPASLTTMYIHQSVRNMRKDVALNPAAALEAIYNDFFNLNLSIEIYFSIFYGVIDFERGEFIYSNGGHNCPPFIKKGNHIEKLEVPGYPMVRILKQSQYENYRTSIDAQTQILLYTDGLVEFKIDKDKPFGVERLKQVFLDNNGSFFERMQDMLDEFSFLPNNDDITYAVIHMNRPK